MADLLTIENVDQVYRSGFLLKKTSVLKDVSLSVPAKSVFGFLGANGAGKTTLIHLICGVRHPHKGEVRISGHPADSIEARKRTGYLPERPYFHEHLTGEEFLFFLGSLSGMPSKQIRSRSSWVLDKVGLKKASKAKLSTYSKGMLQRIGIAQAILHDPELIVLDEPMSGLDPIGRKEIRELIQGLAAEGHTVFFSTHVVPDVEAICNQVALIQAGKIVRQGSVAELLKSGDSRTEIAFLGNVDLGPVKELPGGARLVVVPDDRVDESLRQILKSKGSVLSVSPIRPSLETMLFGKEATHGS